MPSPIATRISVAVLLALGIVALPACRPAANDAASATAAASMRAADPSLIPLPATLQLADGQFVVDATTRLHADGDAAQRVAVVFNDFLAASKRPRIALDAKGAIRFGIAADASASPEGYTLDVTPDGIVVRAAREAGLFRGAMTLLQLLTPANGDAVAVRTLHIEDAPRFAWRGLLLDSARHFRSVDEVKRTLDAMAQFKLNTFHWHLTDDQGWRIEIRKYPKLTDVGGCRVPGGDAGIGADGKPVQYCGYYTQDEIREVVAYAAARHIDIVPEFDVPGHATAAISAHPELGVTDATLAPSSEWGVFQNLFNTEESTFVFLEDVLTEVAALFPGKYIHVGGDEAVKNQWIASPRVQQRMRELGANDEMAMQSHIIKRLETFLDGKGKRLIGWDEILEGGLPPQATVMSWRGTEGGIEAAKTGHDVVMSPASDLYLDYLQTHSPNEPPGRPAIIPLKQVYAFEPVPAALDSAQARHILGLQANAWSEHMRTFARVQHNLFPRLAAVAETGWSPKARKDYPGLLARLPAELARWNAQGVAYAKTPFEVSIAAGDAANGTSNITLGNALGYPDIRYTTDGSAPTAASTHYTAPFDAKLPAKVRAAVFIDGKPLVASSARDITATSLLTRSDEELAMCTGNLMLRLEDDGPRVGERAIFNVDIFNPCWSWKQAPLAGIGEVTVRAGRMPYVFQLANDESHRRFKPAKSAHGELELHAGCDGPALASLPLPAQPDADGFVTLKAAIPAQAKPTDLCLWFTGDTRPTMWVLDRVTLVP